MKRVLTLLALGIALQFNQASAQCTTTNATTCVCPPGQGTDCDLLPDITVSRDAISNSGGTTEYAQTGAGTNYSGQGSDDGRLRLTGATPNIGYGPIEVRGQSRWVCGTDTSLTYPGVGGCPNGIDPKQVVVQRIYHKNGNAMSFTDRLAGTCARLGLTLHISEGMGDNPPRPKRVVVTLLGRPLLARHVAAAAQVITDHGGNIDRSRRLSRQPMTTIEFWVSHADVADLRPALAQAAAEAGFDVAVSPGKVAGWS